MRIDSNELRLSTKLQTFVFLKIFPALGALLLLSSLVCAAHSISLGLPAIIQIDANSAAGSAGAFAAGSGLFFAINQYYRSELVHRSQRALDAACRGVERAWLVIDSDAPTRNIAWVNAARLLLRAQHLSKSITEEYHEREWRLFTEEWKIKFLPFLSNSHEYYFGLPSSDPVVPATKIEKTDIDSIAERSVVETSLEIDGYSSTLHANSFVSERAIRVIFEFTEIYDHNDDPLNNTRGFLDDGMTQVENRHLLGLLAYLKIRLRYLFIGEEVRERSKLND
ncbi:MAG: hypothetical protein IPK75_12280 [Acidobacteria bacterium]|nr:hypothetical protein [Acidobacteriota bacterium]